MLSVEVLCKKCQKKFLREKANDLDQGDLQDGGGLRRGDHLPPHKYIKNTYTCGTTPTEHLLNAGRRPQTSQKMPSGDLHVEAGPKTKLTTGAV